MPIGASALRHSLRRIESAPQSASHCDSSLAPPLRAPHIMPGNLAARLAELHCETGEVRW